MVLERVIVSRKTPLDGRLELSPVAANRLVEIGEPLDVVAGAAHSTGRVESMTCTCVRAGAEPHTHHFLVSTVLLTLAPGAEVDVSVDVAARRVVVAPL